jgi:hypothetical protein
MLIATESLSARVAAAGACLACRYEGAAEYEKERLRLPRAGSSGLAIRLANAAARLALAVAVVRSAARS